MAVRLAGVAGEYFCHDSFNSEYYKKSLTHTHNLFIEPHTVKFNSFTISI